MPLDRVVLNASPLICISKAGLLELLPKLFTDIVVPESVLREVEAGGVSPVRMSWMRSVEVALLPEVAGWDLGAGESAVLSFARQYPGFRAVIDDREARRCAATLQLPHLGTIGCLLLAKERGILPSLRAAIGSLSQAGLWLSQQLVDDVCRGAGE